MVAAGSAREVRGGRRRLPRRAGPAGPARRVQRAPQPANAAPPRRCKSPRPAAIEACPAKDPAAIGRIAAQFLDAARGTGSASRRRRPAPAAKPKSSDIDFGFASEPARKKPEMTLEDEMNRLLGELSTKR